MAWEDFKVVGPFNKERTPQFDAQDTVNWSILLDETGKKPVALQGTPGLHQEIVLQSGTAPVRYLNVFNDVMYALAGTNFYSIDSNKTVVQRGTITTNVGTVFMDLNNAGQIMIADGVAGWIYDTIGGSFTKITNVNFPSLPLGVVYADDYFSVPAGETNQWYLSAPNEGLNWDVFDTATVRKYPGFLTGVAVVGSRMVFYKVYSTEIWLNLGTADFPFRRDNNMIFNTGCTAPGSIYQMEGYLYWLSNNVSGQSEVMMTNGGAPNIISTQAVSNLIHTFVNPNDVQAYVYKEAGHQFYVMSWTTDDTTLVFDQTVADIAGIQYAWSRMAMQPHRFKIGQPYSAKTRHWSSCHAFFNGVHYVGDYRKPVIYSMSLDYGDNAGEPIRRERVFRHTIQPTYQYQQIDALRVDFRQGVGTSTGKATIAPQAYLALSQNDGLSFIDEVPAPLGRIGEYNRRTEWRLLGIHEDFVGKISVYSDVSPLFMLGAAIDRKLLRT